MNTINITLGQSRAYRNILTHRDILTPTYSNMFLSNSVHAMNLQTSLSACEEVCVLACVRVCVFACACMSCKLCARVTGFHRGPLEKPINSSYLGLDMRRVAHSLDRENQISNQSRY